MTRSILHRVKTILRSTKTAGQEALACAVLTAVAFSAPGQAAAQQSQGNSISHDVYGVVALVQVDDSGNVEGLGSGTVISRTGRIITNYHVVGSTTTGRLANSNGLVAVLFSPSEDRPAKLVGYAKYLFGNPNLDLAELQFVADRNANPVNTCQNIFPVAIPLGNSDKLDIGDPLSMLGYPETAMDLSKGLGGVYITFTPARVSGFQTAGDARQWIRTTAPVSHGNSGGAALNAQGQLVGVPSDTYITPGKEAHQNYEKMGLIRPTNFLPAAWFNNDCSLGSLASGSSSGSSGGNASPDNSGSTSGYGNSGNAGGSGGYAEGGQGGSAGEAPASGGILIQGRIVDADTGQGIPGALFAVMRPGWKESDGLYTEYALAHGTADSDGRFTTGTGVKPGMTYPIVILAKGYGKTDGTLPISANAAPLVTLDEPISLSH